MIEACNKDDCGHHHEEDIEKVDILNSANKAQD